jgi:TPR repeat protein
MGEGVPRDQTQAARWFRKAADQGDAMAQSGLGKAYATGEGVPRDLAQAAHWFRKAADQGDATAQGRLGVMYFDGVGVPQDYVQAYMWLNLSASQGIKLAAEERDKVAQRMTPTQIAEARKLARDRKPKPER